MYMVPLFWITVLLIFLFQPLQSQIVLQCGTDPTKCINETDPNTQPCCCFGQNEAGCNNRTDCQYDHPKCRVLITEIPTMIPTEEPTATTAIPTPDPTPHPTDHPSQSPSNTPTFSPSNTPTFSPSNTPTFSPSNSPTIPPTLNPSLTPSLHPTTNPSMNPSSVPTVNPSQVPSYSPSISPSQTPSTSPTHNPSYSPSVSPSQTPSYSPTMNPTSPSISPNSNPVTSTPTLIPTSTPTGNPSDLTSVPTSHPTFNPTYFPTSNPTTLTTLSPSSYPTYFPTFDPTLYPTFNPTYFPTFDPTLDPTFHPTHAQTNNCTECEIYNLTLTNMDANITIKECTKPNVAHCDCDGDGMTSLTLKYIRRSVADRIEIIYKNNIILCVYYNVQLNTEMICDIKETSDYTKFRHITRYRIYYNSQSTSYYCVGQYDTSCNTYILGETHPNCPYLSVNGWTDYHDNVCFNDGTNIIHNNYWKKRTVFSDSSNGKQHKSSVWSRDSSDSSRRRRLSDNRHCVWNNNNNIKYLSDTHNDCDYEYNEKRSYSSSSSSDDDDNHMPSKILHDVCLTYNIGTSNPNCGILESVFMPLCTNNETDFNVSTVTADDITDLIVKYEPQYGVIAMGHQDNNGTLGILTQFITDNITVFELCLANVTMDLNIPMNYTPHSIEIADRVTFTIDNVSSICASDGLPCLNFYLASKCRTTKSLIKKECDCNGGGLLSLTLMYSANYNADQIDVYNRRENGKLLCTFYNVSNGDIMICTEQFKRKVFFKIIYANDYGLCEGIYRTDCSANILGQTSSGCNALIVVGWMDKTEAICDETVSDYATLIRNAYINNKYNLVNAWQVLNQVNIYIKWTLIGMMIMFVLLICIGVALCIFRQKCIHRINCTSMNRWSGSDRQSTDSQMLEHIERNNEEETDAKEESDSETDNAHRRHKSINFDEEEIVMECYCSTEDQKVEEHRSSYTQHTPHKSINLSEEQILNRIWNEHQDMDSTEIEQMLSYEDSDCDNDANYME